MIGQTISHYRIVEKLGEGGMGVVYKAEDTKLGRTVALKFLASHLTADQESGQRFIREAKAAANLDHPNVCTVYEIDEVNGQAFLAMAFLQGRTLKQKIAERPLPLGEALDIATQIGQGLQAAHEQGIVHRDVKPANIMITPQGRVKIMDFGLAQFSDRSRLTQTAVAVGTPAYMSPEQAQRQPTDRRTDLWSLGVVLYEMVTGRLPFEGEREQAVLYAISNEEPESVTALRAGLPMELEWIIGKCLAKNPAERYQHADDLRVDLEALRKKLESGRTSVAPATMMPSTGTPATGVPSTRSAARGVMPPEPVSAGAGASRGAKVWKAGVLAAAMIGVAALAFTAARLFQTPPESGTQRTVKFTFRPANLSRGSLTDIDAQVSVSDDGRHITYVESAERQLWVRDIDQEQARLVPGATGVYQAFWSPDGEFIGYADGYLDGAELRRIPSRGGTPAAVCKLPGRFRGGSWSRDGQTIVFCDTTGLYTVPTKGGPPAQIVKHPHIEQPSFLDLPDGGRAFLFQAVDDASGHGIFVQRSGADQRERIRLSSSSNPYPVYSDSGHILYVDGVGDSSAIWALPFSLDTLKPSGEAFPIAQRGSSPAVSRNGTLVYSDLPSDELQLVWYDRSGKALTTIGPPAHQLGLALSPDGRSLAASLREANGRSIWIYDLERAIKTRFTFEPVGDVDPAWFPSGDEIAFASSRNGNLDIFSKASNGSGEARMLVGTPAPERLPVWSPDGKFLLYESFTPETKRDLIYRERQSDGSLGEARVYLQTPFPEGTARFSPDGRFVVYVSDESGRPEVYVRSFPEGGNKQQVSTNGGRAPRWGRDGTEIFYVERGRLMAVRVTDRPRFSSGPPASLFEKAVLAGTVNPEYDVAAGGQRFMIAESPISKEPLAIHVVHNWFEEFRDQQPQ
jgi:Tol biopolymer transport system component